MEIRPILSALLRNKTGAILVALQVAISMAILANALHIVVVRQAVAARPTGVVAENDIFNIMVRELKDEDSATQVANARRYAATLRAVSGVVSVAQVNQFALGNSGSNSGVYATRTQTKNTTSTAYYETADSLIKTYGLKLEEGRDFNAADLLELDTNTSKEGPKVVIVTRALANKMWPGEQAIGKELFYGNGEDDDHPRVIGVVERLQAPWAQTNDKADYSSIVPIREVGSNFAAITVRAEPGQRDRVMKEAEAAIRASSARPVIVRARTMETDRNNRYRADLALSWMLVTVSVLLLLITASGIVGMASLWVTQRRKQIGVRRALGARRIDILRYFITENFMITSVGVFSGVLLAVGLNTLLVGKFEMAPLPWTYLAMGAAVFWGLGFGAVYGPAWRAASISPALATRSA